MANESELMQVRADKIEKIKVDGSLSVELSFN